MKTCPMLPPSRIRDTSPLLRALVVAALTAAALTMAIQILRH